MTAGKCVIFALVGRRERTKPSQMAVSREGIASACQDFVTCSLMPHIPYNPVVRRIENVVQCDRKLYHSKSAGEMTGIIGHSLYDFLTELAAYLG